MYIAPAEQWHWWRVWGMKKKDLYLFIYLRQNNFLFRHFCLAFLFIKKIFPFVTQFCNFFLSDNGRPSVLYLVFFCCLYVCVYVCLSKAIYLDSDFGQQQQQQQHQATEARRRREEISVTVGWIFNLPSLIFFFSFFFLYFSFIIFLC